MNNNINDRVKAIMSAVFDIPIDNINDESSSNTIKSWDSLKQMNLIVALEEEFGIEFSDDEIIYLMSFKLILESLRSRIE